jgi:hypothetical protein
MSSGEKRIKVKRVRIVADELVIEPEVIIIEKPKKREEEEMLIRLRERY